MVVRLSACGCLWGTRQVYASLRIPLEVLDPSPVGSESTSNTAEELSQWPLAGVGSVFFFGICAPGT